MKKMQKVTLALWQNEILKRGENYQGSRSIIQKKALDVLGWYIIRRNSVEKGFRLAGSSKADQPRRKIST
jgi:hypothetical protein